MKILRFFLIIGLFITTTGAIAQVQPDPAHWAYGLKKLTGNTYEVHLRCTIDDGWHIYAQKQTKDFIGTATKINFAKQPGLVLIGKAIENGKKDTYRDEAAGITNYELSGVVDFVQKVMLKPGLKTLSGKIQYQTCTHAKCLNATDVNFKIQVK